MGCGDSLKMGTSPSGYIQVPPPGAGEACKVATHILSKRVFSKEIPSEFYTVWEFFNDKCVFLRN